MAASLYREVPNQVPDGPLLVDLESLAKDGNVCSNCGQAVDLDNRNSSGMVPCDPMVWGIRPRRRPRCPFVFVPNEQINGVHELDPGIHPISSFKHPLDLARQLNFVAMPDYHGRAEPLTPIHHTLDNGEDLWYVAVDGGFGGQLGTNVQGFARVVNMPHRTILHSVYVLTIHRGHGIGARLLDHALDHHAPLNAYDDSVLWTYLIRRAKVSFENPDVTLLPSFSWEHFAREELAPRLQGVDLLANFRIKEASKTQA